MFKKLPDLWGTFTKVNSRIEEASDKGSIVKDEEYH
jgi:hypothetical protein